MDLVAELSRLARLHADGALTNVEFAQAKAALLKQFIGDAHVESVADAYNARVASAEQAPSAEAAAVPAKMAVWKRRRRVLMLGAAGAGAALLALGAAVAVTSGGSEPSQARNAVTPEPTTGEAPAAAAEDELAFAQSRHSCSELHTWYELNQYDSNAEIARQFYDQCEAVPPPVRNFEIEPWDPEGMFVALMEEAFPQGDTARTAGLIPLGQTFCEAADADMPRYEVQQMATDQGITSSQARRLLEVSVTTLCPEHAGILSESDEPPAAEDPEQLVDQLDSALERRFPSHYIGGTAREIARTAHDTCQAIGSGYGSDAAVLWVNHFRSVNLNRMAEAAGMAVGTFCPENIDRLSP